MEKSSRFTREGAVEDQLQVAPGRGFPEPLPNFLISSNVTWEVDIWKRLRNARSAAAYRYLGTREGWNFVVTRLIADISENYYELLALDNRLQILENTIQIQEQSRETATDFKAAGRGTELAVQRFEAEVRRNQSEKLIVQQEIIEVENEINFAAGRYPQAVERDRVDYVNLNLHALSAGRTIAIATKPRGHSTGRTRTAGRWFGCSSGSCPLLPIVDTVSGSGL